MQKDEYVEFIYELLSPIEPVTIRSMFGGYGVYAQGMMVGLIAYQELYFKSDKDVAEFFRINGSEPFVYEKKDGKQTVMSYWKVVPEVLENEESLRQWFSLAIQSAYSGKKICKRK